jgi:hypothetical protein
MCMTDEAFPDAGLAGDPRSPVGWVRRFLRDNADEVAEAIEPVAYAVGELIPSPADIVSAVAGAAAEAIPEALGKIAEALPDLVSD